MKTISIALRTTINPKLPDEMTTRLQELNMDKRLKKAESIKAYMESAEYQIKTELYASRHAEFGVVSSIAISENGGVETVNGEESRVLDLLEERLVGVERIVVFDADHVLTFLMKRAMLTEHRLTLREKLYSNFGTSTAMVVDIKRVWAGVSKEYGSMTLTELVMYLEYPITVKSHPLHSEVGAEATAIFEVYDYMKGFLCN